MAQLNITKTNRLDAVTTVTDKVGVFIDENGILCGIDENDNVVPVMLSYTPATLEDNDFVGKQTITGTTNDGSTNVLELYDSANTLVGNVDTLLKIVEIREVQI